MNDQTIIKNYRAMASVVHTGNDRQQERKESRLYGVYSFLSRCSFDVSLLDPINEEFDV